MDPAFTGTRSHLWRPCAFFALNAYPEFEGTLRSLLLRVLIQYHMAPI
jgi:hypothetical protein